MLPFSKTPTRKLIDLDYDEKTVGKPFTSGHSASQTPKRTSSPGFQLLDIESKGALTARGGPVTMPSKRAPVRKKGKAKGGGASISLPPPLNCSPVHTTTFRYTATADVAGANVTGSTILAAIGAIGIATSTIAPIASSFLVRSVKIWSSPQDAIGTSTSVTWSATGFSNIQKDQVDDDTIPAAAGTTRQVVARPPRMTLASFWLDNAFTATLFQVYCPKGSILDFRVSYTLCNVFTATSLSRTGAVAGTFYYSYLDGASGKLEVIGRATALG
jgi:hypothetical protein